MKAAIYARVSKERCTAPGCGHLFDEHARQRCSDPGCGRGPHEHKPVHAKCRHAGCRCKTYAGQDPENQLVELRRYAAAQAWEVVEYIDRATGKNSDRDAFKELFLDASRRKFDLVVVWALDRMSREGIHTTFEHLKRLRGYGIQFESYSEPQFRTTGPFGEMFAELMIALAAWMAKQERLRISERTKAGLARARAKGRIGGRPAKIFDRQRALDMRAQKPPVSWRAIARKLGVAQSSIRKALARVHKTSSKKPAKRTRNTW